MNENPFAERKHFLFHQGHASPVNSLSDTTAEVSTVSHELPRHDDGFDRYARCWNRFCVVACSNKQEKKGCFMRVMVLKVSLVLLP